MRYKIVNFEEIDDGRGFLDVFQKGVNIDFDLKRVFYSYNIDDKSRKGMHSNRKSEFLLISVACSCKVVVDDGYNREEFVLDKPSFGLYCDKMVWKEMYDFSQNNVLLVLSSEVYDKDEYIKDYDSFIKEVRNDS